MIAQLFGDKVKMAVDDYAAHNHQRSCAFTILIPFAVRKTPNYALTDSAQWLNDISMKEVISELIGYLRQYLTEEYSSIEMIIPVHTEDKNVKRIINESPCSDIDDKKYYYQRVSNFTIRDYEVPEIFVLMMDKDSFELAA